MSRAELEALLSRLAARGPAEFDDEAARDVESFLALARDADGPALADVIGSCAQLRELYGRYASRRETAEARALLARGTGIAGLARGEGGDFAGRSYARVRDLFEHIDFSACRAFVMVGCGPLPVTLLHVAERTQVPRLIGLEVEPEAACSARDLCRGLGLDRVAIRECDGCEFDYGSADVAYVANLVRPKRAVLCRVADTIRPGARVVVREPSPPGELFAERGAEPHDRRWRVVGRGPEDRQFLSYHLFLTRLDSGH
ncbi:MAG: hypothetical protein ACREOC_12785 [Gemmatimonadales bacterium]